MVTGALLRDSSWKVQADPAEVTGSGTVPQHHSQNIFLSNCNSDLQSSPGTVGFYLGLFKL